jgi:hypothetical protein
MARQIASNPLWENFDVFNNPDGTFHVNVISGDGGYIFADRFNSELDAQWAAALFNVNRPGFPGGCLV